MDNQLETDLYAIAVTVAIFSNLFSKLTTIFNASHLYQALEAPHNIV